MDTVLRVYVPGLEKMKTWSPPKGWLKHDFGICLDGVCWFV